MDKREIIAALNRSGEPAPQRSATCLQPETLAAYLDGGLCESERAAAEEHLADCGFCLRQLAVLIRSAEEHTAAELPADVMAKAERLAAPPARHVGNRFRWAAAAVLVLALGVFATQWPLTGSAPSNEPARQTRYADQDALQPRLLAPGEGSVIVPLEQVFRWSEVPGALFYDVRLVTLDGDLLLRERVEETRWLIPQQLRLEPGADYFVRIDAYLSDAKYFSSEHVLFTVDGTK